VATIALVGEDALDGVADERFLVCNRPTKAAEFRHASSRVVRIGAFADRPEAGGGWSVETAALFVFLA
jgi:hypothetical protein